MLFDFALGLMLDVVDIGLRFLGESFRVKRRLDDFGMLHELKRGLTGVDRQGRIAAIVYREMHAEEALPALVDELQFLGVDGENEADIRGPEAVAVFAVAVEGERAAGVAFRPAEGGCGIFLGGNRQLEKCEGERQQRKAKRM